MGAAVSLTNKSRMETLAARPQANPLFLPAGWMQGLSAENYLGSWGSRCMLRLSRIGIKQTVGAAQCRRGPWCLFPAWPCSSQSVLARSASLACSPPAGQQDSILDIPLCLSSQLSLTNSFVCAACSATFEQLILYLHMYIK